MSVFSPTPWFLPNGLNLWFADSVPSLSTDIGPWQAGDFLWLTSATGGQPSLYKCITAGAPGTWQSVAKGVDSIVTTAAALTVNPIIHDTIILTGNVAVTLPNAGTCNGKRITVKRVGAGNGTVVADHLEAGTTATFAADLSAITLICDTASWRVLNTYGTVNLT